MKLFRSGFGVSVLSLAAIAAGYFGGRPLLERVQFDRAEADVQSTRQQLSTVEDLSTVFRHVGEVVGPSVVEIQVHKTVKQPRMGMNGFGDDQLRKFFQDHGFGDMNPGDNGNGNGNNNDEQDLQEIGTGSGVIVETDGTYGYVVTNNHVAGDSTSMEVTLADGRKITGSDVKLLGADPKSDLAVVQIKADRLIPAQWGNSDDLEKGDWVMAFGAPFGYVGSMTHGIVSALNRNDIEGTQDYENFIQVDAPINPGNSGGPLVNIHGEVIGINTAIATVSGGFQGIGFAIPSNQAKTIYGELKSHGKVVRGWLGIGIADVTDEAQVAKYLGYQGTTGVLVTQTYPGTPAAGKLFHGDIITALNGQPISNKDQLRNIVADTAPDTTITLQVFRNGKQENVQITLGNQPEDIASVIGNGENDANQGPGMESQSPEALGMSLKSLDADTAQSLGLTGVRSGAVITAVQKDSVAAQAGLQEGDVITEVGRTPVHNAQEAIEALKKVDISKGVPLYIATREGSQFVFIQSGNSQK